MSTLWNSSRERETTDEEDKLTELRMFTSHGERLKRCVCESERSEREREGKRESERLREWQVFMV